MLFRKKKNNNWRLIKLSLWILFIILGINFLQNKLTKDNSSAKVNVKPVTNVSLAGKDQNSNTDSQALKSEVLGASNSKELEKSVNQALEGTKGTYGIVIKNLKSGQYFALNEHRLFQPASIYKLWIMAIIRQQIQHGQLKENDTVSGDLAALNEEFYISPQDAEFNQGEMSFTVKSALHQMITISHNYASLILTSKIGLPAVEKFISDNKFYETKVGLNGDPPLTTPNDTALFFDKLYHQKLADETNSQEMLSLLKKQTLNYALPKYLPPSVEVAHKTGKIDSFTHDSGIVFLKEGDYIIVVFSETDSVPQAEERIALISKSVYDYFKSARSD